MYKRQVVLVPTSMPTWHMIPMKESSTIGLPSNLKHSPKPEALPSFFSSSIEMCIRDSGGTGDTGYHDVEIWSTLTSTKGELDVYKRQHQ